MKKNKICLKKINNVNNNTVRTLDCHCGCEGKIGSAYSKGFVGQFF